eukprot:TRINITY_DN12184_c0_g1_i1.p1 TRINITY_DN12184_c0_g1~~TRINITY_DN12184_c0_g1_i1.p1  ORF type:complete len:230 (+),score=44.48 TRINITY_DN12184_c0_g1_i1:36-725(+)
MDDFQVHRSVEVCGVTVRMVEGDISKVGSDVVVNAANTLSFMPMDSGVSGALRNASKPEVVVRQDKVWWSDDGTEHRGKRMPVLQAGVQVAQGGLAAQGVKHVVHAVGPNWNDYPASDAVFKTVMPRIRKTVSRALSAAARVGATTCTIPAISGGIFTHYSPTTDIKSQEQHAARVAVAQAVKRWAANNSNTSLTTIDLIDLGSRTQGALHMFIQAFDHVFSEQDPHQL